MSELNKALDKLRNKDFTIWCVFRYPQIVEGNRMLIQVVNGRRVDSCIYEEQYYNPDHPYDSVKASQYIIDKQLYHQGEFSEEELTSMTVEDLSIDIIWHPLKRGRLSYLRSKLGEIDERFKIAEIPMIFEEHIELYDQNELQRMKHEKRPELEKLLIEFSTLLPTLPTNETNE